jgi:hypothetical protein
VGFYGGQSGTGAGFLRVLRFPVPRTPPTAPHSPSSIIIRGCCNRPTMASAIVDSVTLHPIKALCEGLRRDGAFLSSPQDGNRPSFQNVVFSSYLDFRMMDEVQKPNDSQYKYQFLFVSVLISNLNLMTCKLQEKIVALLFEFTSIFITDYNAIFR